MEDGVGVGFFFVGVKLQLRNEMSKKAHCNINLHLMREEENHNGWVTGRKHGGISRVDLTR